MGPCADRSIRVEVLTQPKEHVILVEDRGQGIPGDELERIFDVFHSRARGASRGSSTGMGLAIVRKIAEVHGGRAWAESEPGRGARFFVSLPRD